MAATCSYYFRWEAFEMSIEFGLVLKHDVMKISTKITNVLCELGIEWDFRCDWADSFRLLWKSFTVRHYCYVSDIYGIGIFHLISMYWTFSNSSGDMMKTYRMLHEHASSAIISIVFRLTLTRVVAIADAVVCALRPIGQWLRNIFSLFPHIWILFFLFFFIIIAAFVSP